MYSPFCFFVLCSDELSDEEQHHHGCKQGENGVELNGDAEDHTLCPVVGVLCEEVDGRGCDLTLCDSGNKTADADGQAGCKVAAAVNEAEVCCGLAVRLLFLQVLGGGCT